MLSGVTTPTGNRLMLLDSASLYFRAFFGVKGTFTAPDGTPVNAVRGFLDMIAALLTMRRPDRLVACWDEDWRPAFRVAAIPSYKRHRVDDPALNTEGNPPGLEIQVPGIVEGLQRLGIARVGAPGFEADDVLGTLAAREVAAAARQRRTADVEVVTGDRDLFQVVDDAAGVRVLYVGKGVRNLEVVDQAWLAAKYGIPSGPAYADLATLRGDASDGLPGVAGIGERTAAGLISRFGGLDGLRAAAADPGSDLSPGQRRRLTDAADYLDAAPGVVRVALDAPVNEADDRLPASPPDHDALIAYAKEWGVESSVTRVVKALG